MANEREDGVRQVRARFWRAAMEHRGLVEGLCRRLDREPDDCVQEVWERVIRECERYDPRRGTLRTWIATIARRLIVDRHRRREVRDRPLPEPEARRPDEEGRIDLERALGSLAPELRRVLVFHHHQGLSLADIAELERVPLGTVKSRLHRARARLVERLEEHDA